MNKRIKKALPLLGALVFLMIGAALAVPTFNLNVQQIGEGGPETITVPGGVGTATINWVLATNPDFVKGVKVTFDQALDAGVTIIVKVYANGDDPNDPNTAPTIVKQVTLSSALAANTPYEIDFDSPVKIKSMDKVAVILVGPNQ